jgi:NADPH:quinone reductase-like Zn-dependent oxidoreductase
VRVAIDAVGGETGAAAVACLAPGGTLLAMGLMSGDPRMPIDVGDLLFKSSTVRGFWLNNWFAAHPPAHTAAAITEVLALLATGRLDPPVAAEYDLADFGAALAHAERPGRSGKVLLVG